MSENQTTVKFLAIVPCNGQKDEITIICEDGGVGSAYHNGEHIVVEHYQDRITPDTNLDDMWDILAEGKLYLGDYEGVDEVNDEIINDIMDWMYMATSPIEKELITVTEFCEEDIKEFLKG